MGLLFIPKAQQLADLVDKLANPAYVAAELHLYSNDITPDQNSLLADFTECVYSGYAAASLTFSAPFFDETGDAVSTAGENLFVQTGATPDSCFGAFLTNTAGTVLLGAARLDDAPFDFVVSGDALPLTFLLSMLSGILNRTPGP